MKPDNLESGSVDIKIKSPENVDSGKVNNNEQVLHKTGNGDTDPVAGNKSCKSPRKRKKSSTSPRGKKYLLRSSGDDVRVLRSRSIAKSKIPAESVITTVNPVMKRRKKRRKLKTTTDEYSMARKRIRYLLNRMSYEQNLIDAYAGEGWKGQSAEKIRPEKELDRAKSEILRCKLKIRDLFRHLDSLSCEGRFQESLFDSEGQISSEDIFCAKCGSKDLSADNDIILCDGICDRGFHQKCLNPPLLSADIPVGDEGWLCPACDCKVDFIDLLNESQGSDISIEDTWEKVFPEAAAIANGDNQYHDFPSDDSEDHEYDPDSPEIDVEDHEDEANLEEESDSEESEYASSSDDSDASERPKKNEILALPSDDSEDDDFDPDVPDPDKVIQKDGSSSDESDFTSDSDDFCKELSKTAGANEDCASDLPKSRRSAGNTNYTPLNSEVLSTLEGDLNEDNVLVPGKRQIERLDYKKLLDESYGKSSSDSSEDEDWLESAEMSTPKKMKKGGTREGTHVVSKANTRKIKNKSSSRSAVGNLVETEAASQAFIGQSQESHLEGEDTPSKTLPKLDLNTVGVDNQHLGFQESDSSVSKSSTHRRLGNIVKQRLYECFKENPYPTREKKDSLAQELGISPSQVHKWFINTRHSYRVSGKESILAAGGSQNKENNSNVTCENNKHPEDVVGQSDANEEDRGKKSAASRKSEVSADEGNIKLATGASLLKEKPDDLVGQSSFSQGKNWLPATISNAGAKNDSVADDKPGQSSSVKEDVDKSSRPKGRAEHGNIDEDSTELDKDRQKAIARELRRMKKRR